MEIEPGIFQSSEQLFSIHDITTITMTDILGRPTPNLARKFANWDAQIGDYLIKSSSCPANTARAAQSRLGFRVALGSS
jgi:hypothetical protein